MSRSTLALALGRPYLRWSARRRLDGVWVDGLQRARSALARGPVIFAANHVSWWDGCLGVLAEPALGAQSAYLIDAEGLQRFPFLGWFGAVAIDRRSTTAIRRGLARATDWLDGPGRALWIYPQGRQRPAHLRPLGLQRGATWIARRSQATILPVALQYGWRTDHRPAAALSFGEPVQPTLEALEEGIVRQLAQLDAFFDGATQLPALLGAPRSHVDSGVGARLLSLGARRGP